MNMQFQASNNAAAKSRKCHINFKLVWEAGTNSKGFKIFFSNAVIQIFLRKMLKHILIFIYIITKETYRIKPDEFLITEHIFGKNDI